MQDRLTVRSRLSQLFSKREERTGEDRPTILLPLRVLEGDAIPEGVPDLLTNAHVVLLGYHVVPDQTATDQARTQFEEQAIRRLDDFTAILEDAGATVESRVVFTHDGQQTIDRISDDHDCLAVLVPNATRPIEQVLVAVRGMVGLNRFVRVVSGLFANLEIHVTLYHVADEDASDEDVEMLLDGIATQLSEEGISPDLIDTEISRGGKSQDMIVETADNYDTIVMGESDRSVRTLLFGMSADQVATQFLGPVFVIQHEEPKDHEVTDTE